MLGATAAVLMGKQFQGHNPRPGPMYAGGGYSLTVDQLKEHEHTLRIWLTKYPDLANEISTGGAQPLHMCGMAKSMENKVEILVS